MTTRAEQARRTRLRVVESARAAFLELGYGAATIKEVARRAGVSQETVYKSFGNKAGLLKAAYDIALAGDDEPVPMADRPEIQAVRAARSPREAARAYAALVPAFAARIGPLATMALHASGADADLAAFVAETGAERLAGATGTARAWEAAGWLREGVGVEQARDVVWMLSGPSLHELARARGWGDEEFVDWASGVLLATVLDPEAGGEAM